jgi:hypothetical protein
MAIVALFGLTTVSVADVIDFEGLTEEIYGSVTTSGFLITSQSAFYIGGDGFCTPECAQNRTKTLITQIGDVPLFVRHRDGTPFDASSLDYGEKHINSQYPTHLIVEGTRIDGTVVSAAFNVDGINDGGGPLVDFQNAVLPNSFRDLTQLSFTTAVAGVRGRGFVLDNINATPVPEPTSSTLFVLGAVAVLVRYRFVNWSLR